MTRGGQRSAFLAPPLLPSVLCPLQHVPTPHTGRTGTLDTVCEALWSGSAIVVVEGSGGVADAIAAGYQPVLFRIPQHLWDSLEQWLSLGAENEGQL